LRANQKNGGQRQRKIGPASDTTASNITPISNTFVHSVTLRLLKRSAR